MSKHILKKNTKLIDIIKAMMPGGSVIGCPKIRTLELLNNQEKESRNIFTGSFGLIKFNQDMKFNIIIRSILNYKNQSQQYDKNCKYIKKYLPYLKNKNNKEIHNMNLNT